ncbi:MAG: YgiQ family radical SAM protein [Peptococcaceae bacterium]|nr:YgiQ family radical SAM protein [Peptococcaceae bacterium]
MAENLFLPVNRKDMEYRGWDELDFVLVTGDAYVDHPSFGTALVGRLLEKEGFRVGIIAQPDFTRCESMKTFGRPKYAFLVASGNIDSMVNHYTAAKKPRSSDAYSPGGQKGMRPDRAVDVYCRLVKEAYPDVPIMIGGVEASLRRFAHYDYWDEAVRPSILETSGADLLMYGMSENQLKELSHGFEKGWPLHKMKNVQGTCYWSDSLPKKGDYIVLPSYEAVKKDKKKFAEAFAVQNKEQNPFLGKILVQPHGDRYLIQLPPAKPLSQKEMDEIYQLPFQRTYHPRYEKAGGIPALLEVEFSITDHRGCYGGCTFCAINFHQGRIIQNRSKQSIVEEAKLMTTLPNFKGYIHDVGGPTGNFRNMSCKKQLKVGACKERQCLFPDICPNLEVDHKEYLDILRTVRNLDKVKKVFIRSGVRFDYILADPDPTFFDEMCEHHISGLLKVAPEHVSPHALHYMGKPQRHVYEKFVKRYFAYNKRVGKEQYLVPYFMSSHPGCTLEDAVILAEYIRDIGYNPEQVQDFIPTPGSMATAMYYSGYDPRSMEKVYVPRDPHEKAMQRALMQYRNPKNYDLVYEALIKANRQDLIGFGPNCLIRPTKPKESADRKKPSGLKQGGMKAPAGRGKQNGKAEASGKNGSKPYGDKNGKGRSAGNSAKQKPGKGEKPAFAKSGGRTDAKSGGQNRGGRPAAGKKKK